MPVMVLEKKPYCDALTFNFSGVIPVILNESL